MTKYFAEEGFAERTNQTQLVAVPTFKHEIFNADEKSRRGYYGEIFAFLQELHEAYYKNDTGNTNV